MWWPLANGVRAPVCSPGVSLCPQSQAVGWPQEEPKLCAGYGVGGTHLVTAEEKALLPGEGRGGGPEGELPVKSQFKEMTDDFLV